MYPCERKMQRRRFLGVLGAGAAAISAPRPARAAPRAAKPNLLLLLSDDHGVEHAGCYGSTWVRTPNLDRLAAQGVRFTRAFTATAMCTPSRSALYTGLFPHRNGAHPNHSKVRPGTKSLPHYLRPLGYRVALAGKRHIGPREAFPFEYLSRGQVGRFLAEVRSEPFCLIVATHDPHTPWKKKGPYSPDRVVVPPYLVDTPETREALARYANSVAALDQQVGELMEQLERRGLAGNTLFLYAGDHGSGLPFTKWTLYDAGIRVPFIVRWPGRVEAGTVCEAMVSFVDVVPTFVEAAGGAAPEGLDGRSFLPVLEGKRSSHRDLIYATHTTEGIISGSVYPVRAVRTERHKYIVNLNPDGEFRNIVTEGRKGGRPPAYWLSWQEKARTDPRAARRVRLYQHRPREELYDLKDDPYELHNLADRPALRPLMDGLRRKLADWMKQQGDPLLDKLEGSP
ncbi:MAG: sulfatase [Candidatus Brocadiia bacterium]